MTRCPCSKGICRTGTSFFYKVLSSLKQLQCNRRNANGASLEEITKFMDEIYNLSGDVDSQVENALCSAESFRFVIKKKNLYALVSPAATLQFTPAPCIKAKLERIQEVFNSRWFAGSKDRKYSCRKLERSSYSPLHFIPSTENTCSSPSSVRKTRSKAKLCPVSSKCDLRKLRPRSISGTSLCNSNSSVCSSVASRRSACKRRKRRCGSVRRRSKKKKRTNCSNNCLNEEIIAFSPQTSSTVAEDSDSDSSEC